jgi:hypothetical protein
MSQTLRDNLTDLPLPIPHRVPDAAAAPHLIDAGVLNAILAPAIPVAVRMPEAVRISGLSRASIYRHGAAGKIRFFKDGRSSLIDVESLLATVRSLPLARLGKHCG